MSDISFSTVCNWLKFKHLVLIDTLARTRNMHAAALHMNLSQPAVSKMLREIERLLGFDLFERLPRNMPPTALGEHVVRYAQIALNDANKFVDQISSLREGGHGFLKVGAIFAATAVVLPDAIVQLKQRWPLLSIEIVEQTNENQQQVYDFQALAPEPFCMVVNSRHPLTELDEAPLQELGKWPWILYPVGTPIRARMEQAFAQAGIATPKNTIDTISMQTFLQVLQSGPMIAMLPASMAQPHLETGLLKVLNTPLKLAPQDYGILTRRGEPLLGAASEFAEILLANAQVARQ
jgi:DNA-binding transcriptional LysR family regulator